MTNNLESFSRFDSPPNFGGSSSLRSGIGKSPSRHYDFPGNVWSKSFGESTDYIKQISQGELHVHAPNGFVTGANLKTPEGKKDISNYDACMLDLQHGSMRVNKLKF